MSRIWIAAGALAGLLAVALSAWAAHGLSLDAARTRMIDNALTQQGWHALALVAAGEGITLVPSLALEAFTTEGVDALDIPGLGMRRIVLRHLSRSRGRNALLETTTTLIREAAAAFSYEPTG